MLDHQSLVLLPPCQIRTRAARRTAIGALYGGAIASPLAAALLVGGWPLLPLGLLGFAALLGIVFGAMAEPAAVAPIPLGAIRSAHTRMIYQGILDAFVAVERAIDEAPRLRALTSPVAEQCRTLAVTAGRLALQVNPLQRFLDAQHPGFVEAEIARLRESAGAAPDDDACSALSRATAARTRQLALCDRIAAQRDRIHAQLELVRATLASIVPAIVKLHGDYEAEAIGAGESIRERLDDLDAEIGSIEAVLGPGSPLQVDAAAAVQRLHTEQA